MPPEQIFGQSTDIIGIRDDLVRAALVFHSRQNARLIVPNSSEKKCGARRQNFSKGVLKEKGETEERNTGVLILLA